MLVGGWIWGGAGWTDGYDFKSTMYPLPIAGTTFHTRTRLVPAKVVPIPSPTSPGVVRNPQIYTHLPS